MSLLQFAKEFAKLKSDLAAQPVPDLQLLCLIDFWPSLADHAAESSYRSYLDEYVPLLLHLISAENLSDLTMHELLHLQDVLADLSALESVNDKLKDQRRLVSQELARRYFYAGAVEDALTICIEPSWAAEAVGRRSVAGEACKKPDTSTTKSKCRVSLPRTSASEHDLQDLSEFEAFESIIEHTRGRDNSLDAFLSNLHDDWQGDRDAIYHDRINALFVDKDDAGRAWRGRMKSLTGKVELFGKSATTDEITFDNQIKSPDDPFIGVAYHSLDAVRQSMKRARFRKQSEAFYHAHFAVENSQQTFTGDSIGLATGLLTYAQLLEPEIMRQDKFIGADIAVTGGVDDSGAVTQVNDDTLKLKIERAFFSPVRHIIVPDGNLSAAREHIEKLRERYPRRRLRLIGVESLTDAIENRNIIREEKVCIGEFVTKQVYHYSRTAKIQVPILLILAYFLLCMIYPKAWVGFDWNPASVELTETGFVALNADSRSLWSVEYECELLYARSQWTMSDLNGDGMNDVVFMPMASPNAPCRSNAHLFAYDHTGKELFARQGAVLGEYVSDTSANFPYSAGLIDVVQVSGTSVIVSRVYASYPARYHIKMWSTDGDSLGWYINSGYSGVVNEKCFAVDRYGNLMFLALNNRMGCACFFVIAPDSSYGVSPPYPEWLRGQRGLRHGNQLCYLLFPRTDINREIELDYNGPFRIVINSSDEIRVDIGESKEPECNLSYFLDENFRVTHVKADDRFIPLRRRLIDEGKLPSVDLSTYLANLVDSVTYWTDSGWVTEGELRALEKN